MALIEHLESRLGQITGGWTSATPDGPPRHFQVAAFAGGMFSDLDAYATIGLSKHELLSRTTGQKLRLELFAGGHAGAGTGFLPGLVGQVGDELLATGEAVLRGDVIGPRGPLVPDSNMAAWYAAIPVYYDQGFASVDLGEGQRAAIVWLVPISRAEAEFVSVNGWRKFESLLVDQDPDLFDLYRPEMSL